MPSLKTYQEQDWQGLEETVVVIETSEGTMRFRLYPEVAPQTTANFADLVRQGFYDGLIFHRIIDGFMIQGGDPAGNGTGGPEYRIQGEFTRQKSHIRGSLSMARSSHPDSAGSQFFICTDPQPHLDGQYALFGDIIDGEEVITRIAQVETNPTNDRPYHEVTMNRVYFEER